jgi:hypothetical protein
MEERPWGEIPVTLLRLAGRFFRKLRVLAMPSNHLFAFLQAAYKIRGLIWSLPPSFTLLPSSTHLYADLNK